MSKSNIVFHHLADIHIRDDRRAEYRHIFEEVGRSIRRRNNELKTAISYGVIAGDLFEHKTRLTAANVMDFQYLINVMLNTCDYVVLMIGNHDTNLNNPLSIDLISPLVKIMNNDRLVHCVESGSYTIPPDSPPDRSVCFNIISPSDPCVRYLASPTARYNVCMLHETVDGVDINGFRMSGRISIDELSMYDAVFCGHIHEFMPVGANGAYSGSLVQQSVGETFNKGYVEWVFPLTDVLTDVPHFIQNFIEIPNDYGYIKVCHKNIGSVYDTGAGGSVCYINRHPNMATSNRLPPKPYQILIDNIDPKLADILGARLLCDTQSGDVGVLPVVRHTNIEHKVLEDETQYSNVPHNVLCQSDRDDQLKLFREHMNDSKISEAIQNKVINLYTKLSEDEATSHQINTVMWRLVHMEWSNMYSYGQNNVLSFDTGHMSSNASSSTIYGIIADNMMGKSSIIDIITLMLYNKQLRGDRECVVNKKCSNAEAYIKFEADGHIHEIYRTFSRIKNTTSNSVIYRIDGVDATSENTIITYEKIQCVIGTFDDFCSIYAMAQGRLDDFIYKNNQDKFRYIKDLLRINMYEDKLEKVKNMRRDATAMRAALTCRTLSDINIDIKNTHSSIDNTTKNLKATEAVLTLCKNIIPVKPTYDSKQLNATKQEIKSIETAQKAVVRRPLIAPFNPPSIRRPPTKDEIEIAKMANIDIDMDIDMDIYMNIDIDRISARLCELKHELRGHSRPLQPVDVSETECRSESEVDRCINERSAELQKVELNVKSGAARFEMYVPYVNKFKLDELYTEQELHSQIDAISQYADRPTGPPVSDWSYVDDQISELTVKLRTAERTVCDFNAHRMKCSSYEMALDVYNMYNNMKCDMKCDIKCYIEHDIDIHNEINVIKVSVSGRHRGSAVIKKELAGDSSSSINDIIIKHKQKLLSMNSTFKDISKRLLYKQECECCDANRILIDGILSLTPPESKDTLNKLIERKKTVQHLEIELKNALEYEANLAKINDIKASLYHDITFDRLLYVYDNYDQITKYKNAKVVATQAQNSIQEYRDEIGRLMYIKQHIKYTNLVKSARIPYKCGAGASLNTISAAIQFYDRIVAYGHNVKRMDDLKAELTQLYAEKRTFVHQKFDEYDKLMKQRSMWCAWYVKMYNDMIYFENEAKLSKLRGIVASAEQNLQKYEEDLRKHAEYTQAIHKVSDLKLELQLAEHKMIKLIEERNTAKRAADLDDDQVVYNTFIKTFDTKTGIPVGIINLACRRISTLCNNALKNMNADFTVNIYIESKTKISLLNIDIVRNKCVLPVEMGSGYQKFAVSMALRRALATVAKKPKFNLFIIDEWFSNLDEANTRRVLDALLLLKNQDYGAHGFNIMLISHDDTIKAFIETPIYVIKEKDTGFSHTEFGTSLPFQKSPAMSASASTSASASASTSASSVSNMAQRTLYNLNSGRVKNPKRETLIKYNIVFNKYTNKYEIVSPLSSKK